MMKIILLSPFANQSYLAATHFFIMSFYAGTETKWTYGKGADGVWSIENITDKMAQ